MEWLRQNGTKQKVMQQYIVTKVALMRDQIGTNYKYGKADRKINNWGWRDGETERTSVNTTCNYETHCGNGHKIDWEAACCMKKEK